MASEGILGPNTLLLIFALFSPAWYQDSDSLHVYTSARTEISVHRRFQATMNDVKERRTQAS